MSLQFVTRHYAGYLSLVHYLVCPWDRYLFRHVVIDISFRRSQAGNQTQLIFWGWTDQSRTKWVVPKNKLLAEFRCWKMPLLLFALCSHSFQHRNSVRKFIWHILYVKRFLYWSLYWVPKGAVKSVTGPLSLFSGVHLIIWEARWWGFAPAEKSYSNILLNEDDSLNWCESQEERWVGHISLCCTGRRALHLYTVWCPEKLYFRLSSMVDCEIRFLRYKQSRGLDFS